MALSYAADHTPWLLLVFRCYLCKLAKHCCVDGRGYSSLWLGESAFSFCIRLRSMFVTCSGICRSLSSREFDGDESVQFSPGFSTVNWCAAVTLTGTRHFYAKELCWIFIFSAILLISFSLYKVFLQCGTIYKLCFNGHFSRWTWVSRLPP